MRIGVLAVQGAFIEHINMLNRLNAEALPVRRIEELKGIDGLIIPGGESTAISRMMSEYNLASEIKNLALKGLPVFGTCAGMILMAKNINGCDSVQCLGLMEIKVKRNAFGRQIDSFEQEITVPVLGNKPFPAVFIRAPYVEEPGKSEIISRLDDGKIIAVRQGKLLATAFHPELTDDLRFHQYFLTMIDGSTKAVQ